MLEVKLQRNRVVMKVSIPLLSDLKTMFRSVTFDSPVFQSILPSVTGSEVPTHCILSNPSSEFDFAPRVSDVCKFDRVTQ